MLGIINNEANKAKLRKLVIGEIDNGTFYDVLEDNSFEKIAEFINKEEENQQELLEEIKNKHYFEGIEYYENIFNEDLNVLTVTTFGSTNGCVQSLFFRYILTQCGVSLTYLSKPNVTSLSYFLPIFIISSSP